MKTYVVSGAASGIGAATAALLREQGHRVIGVDRPGHRRRRDRRPGDRRGTRGGGGRRTGADRRRSTGWCRRPGSPGCTGVDSALLVSVNFFGAIALVDRPARRSWPRPRRRRGRAPRLQLDHRHAAAGTPRSPRPACATTSTLAREAAAKVEAVMVYPASKAALAWWARPRGRRSRTGPAPASGSTPSRPARPRRRWPSEMRADPVFGPPIDAYPNAIGRPGRPEEVAAAIVFLSRRRQPASSAPCSSSTAAPTRSCTRSPRRAGRSRASSPRLDACASPWSSARAAPAATPTSARSPRSRRAGTRSSPSPARRWARWSVACTPPACSTTTPPGPAT